MIFPEAFAHHLRSIGQEHLLTGFDALTEPQQAHLLTQIESIDFAQLAQLYHHRDQPQALPADEAIAPIAITERAHVPPEDLRRAEQSLLSGELAVLLVAGGQGTRLGFDRPKGLYPVGPVSGASLFAIHASKVLALRRRYGKPIPFLVMTSDATDAETRAYFQAQHYFGLPADEVYFFRQGTMPALDLATGKVLLDKPGNIFLSPNGHGGTLTALADSGLLEEIKGRGVKSLFYFQVDNPLVKIGDSAFLAAHLAHRSEASSKCIDKSHAGEKMGVLANIANRCGIIEYSDLPKHLAEAQDEKGGLLHRAGSPAIHLFDIDFLERVTAGKSLLPFHYARKKVACLDAVGKPFQPTSENALKFEMFIFDALPLAERWLVMRSPRDEEFMPLKNASGADSPATVKVGMIEQAARWLEAAGATVERDVEGACLVALEIAPTYALDPAEVAARVPPGRHFEAATYLG